MLLLWEVSCKEEVFNLDHNWSWGKGQDGALREPGSSNGRSKSSPDRRKCSAWSFHWSGHVPAKGARFWQI